MKQGCELYVIPKARADIAKELEAQASVEMEYCWEDQINDKFHLRCAHCIESTEPLGFYAMDYHLQKM